MHIDEAGGRAPEAEFRLKKRIGANPQSYTRKSALSGVY
jgi:hypothetical protein